MGVQVPLVAPSVFHLFCNYTRDVKISYQIPVFYTCPPFYYFANIELQRMKKFGLILAGCLAFIGFDGAHSDNLGDAVRAAVRRDTNTVSVSNRQRSDNMGSVATSRNASAKGSGVVNRSSDSSNRSAGVVNRAATTTAPAASVVARTTAAPRATTTTQNVKKRTTAGTATRTRAATRTKTPTRTARAATSVATRDEILNRSYSKCREIFNECMDEFCANKDSQLKRCACSVRVNDFDKIKKQLADVDEKMLDFNQRLLTVSMDEKDVAALNIATEGEKAFYDTKDTSESKRTLDEIAKKLNIDFDKNTFTSTNLGTVLSWSLDFDNAFDDIDSLGGISTSAKTGTALYTAALPICREMAAEVCSDEDLSLAESGYQVLVERDCDTVEKTYRTAADQARNKVLESSALLDISRLNVYQKNNADDILTCKKKMLTMLSDSTVCGSDLGKCLDITGQYIDPSTGEAFLSADLANLASLITRPDENQTWSRAPGNDIFVSFLNSKKKFLEPAMEHCQDIADTVWNAFIEDALSQIKIAQLRKLEQVRQSCTTLTAQCLTNASDSLTAFDSRALSIFGVAADATANAICQDVLSSCSTLLQQTDTEQEWYTGMTGIQTDITYDSIKHTCREVGRACIIQVCTSTSGNFGLCEDIDTSINRKSIVNRTACWDEVLACVDSAGEDAINAIFKLNKFDDTDTYALYNLVYANGSPMLSNVSANVATCTAQETADSPYCVYDICAEQCSKDGVLSPYVDTHECRVCRLAESIWGNCEAAPTTSLVANKEMHNRIQVRKDLQNTDTDATTLLYWFAQNTNTADLADSCRDTTCAAGFRPLRDATTGAIMCVDRSDMDSLDQICSPTYRIPVSGSISNCCLVENNQTIDKARDCCIQGKTDSNSGSNTEVCVPNETYTLVTTFEVPFPDGDSETGDGSAQYYATGTSYYLYCAGTLSYVDEKVKCSGHYFVVQKSAPENMGLRYFDPKYNVDTPTDTSRYVCEYFNTDLETKYIHEYDSTGGWKWHKSGTTDTFNENETLRHWMVKFGGC